MYKHRQPVEKKLREATLCYENEQSLILIESRVCSVNQNSHTLRSCLIISNSTDLVLLIKTRNLHKRPFLTSPGGTLGSSTVTKYAGIR